MKNEDEKIIQKDSFEKVIIEKSGGVFKAEKSFRRLLRGHITSLIK